MPERIDLSKDNPTLQALFEEAKKFSENNASELSLDQIAILNLMRVLDLQEGSERPENECFICATGA